MDIDLSGTTDVLAMGKAKLYPWGTILRFGLMAYRYARAGADLKANRPAYAHFEGELVKDADGRLIWGEVQAEAIWVNMLPDFRGNAPQGYPPVDVPKGHSFWLRVG
jgi:hypothetical protein